MRCHSIESEVAEIGRRASIAKRKTVGPPFWRFSAAFLQETKSKKESGGNLMKV
jgi:hypothetical protein